MCVPCTCSIQGDCCRTASKTAARQEVLMQRCLGRPRTRPATWRGLPRTRHTARLALPRHAFDFLFHLHVHHLTPDL